MRLGPYEGMHHMFWNFVMKHFIKHMEELLLMNLFKDFLWAKLVVYILWAKDGRLIKNILETNPSLKVYLLFLGRHFVYMCVFLFLRKKLLFYFQYCRLNPTSHSELYSCWVWVWYELRNTLRIQHLVMSFTQQLRLNLLQMFYRQ